MTQRVCVACFFINPQFRFNYKQYCNLVHTKKGSLKVDGGYWDKKENVKLYLNRLKEKYDLNTVEDWDSITTKQIQSTGGGSLLNKCSLYELKCMGYPSGKLKFTPNRPPGYWDDVNNIKLFLNTVKEKYNLQSPKDWNEITQLQIKSMKGGNTLLNQYSLFELKCLACPEGKSLFNLPSKPTGYWHDNKNVLEFLSNFKNEYNLKTPDDWNSITWNQIKSFGGRSLFKNYSMFELKCLICPEGKQKFQENQLKSKKMKKPNEYWENENNVLEFLKDLKIKLNLQSFDDWNSISRKQIQAFGGYKLFEKYSLYDLKCFGFPEGKANFTKPPKPASFWDNEKNVLDFIFKLKEEYNLQTPDDWKRLSKNQIISQGGTGLISKFSLRDIIKIHNPTLKLDDDKKNKCANKLKKSSQRWLFLLIQKLFPGEEIVEDYFHSEISRISGANVQFDIFMIERKIAIEYHGKHHYEEDPYTGASIEMYKCRDQEKANLCKKYGIQLIIIPYWWDNRLDSLKLTLESIVA